MRDDVTPVTQRGSAGSGRRSAPTLPATPRGGAGAEGGGVPGTAGSQRCRRGGDPGRPGALPSGPRRRTARRRGGPGTGRQGGALRIGPVMSDVTIPRRCIRGPPWCGPVRDRPPRPLRRSTSASQTRPAGPSAFPRPRRTLANTAGAASGPRSFGQPPAGGRAGRRAARGARRHAAGSVTGPAPASPRPGCRTGYAPGQGPGVRVAAFSSVSVLNTLKPRRR